MRPGPVGMVLDRVLPPDLLDVALRVATEHRTAPNARRLLAVALRDRVSVQEAEGKTKKCLTRVWVAPPSTARAMIRWAIEHQAEAGDRAALHFVALLATFPFVGSVATLAGRQIYFDGKVEPRRVKAEARGIFGDRSTIDIGVRKVLTTMRELALLEGPDGGPYAIAKQPRLSPAFGGWALHALLLTRQVESIGRDELLRAFELATLTLEPAEDTYPLVEFHSEGGRTVAVAR